MEENKNGFIQRLLEEKVNVLFIYADYEYSFFNNIIEEMCWFDEIESKSKMTILDGTYKPPVSSKVATLTFKRKGHSVTVKRTEKNKTAFNMILDVLDK